MGTLNDNVNTGIRILRDHDSGVVNTYDKSVSYGATCSSQDSDSGFFNLTNYGDIAGWGYWPPNTRTLGIYSQAVPVVMVSGGLQPILNSSMAPDTSFQIQACPGTVNPIDGSIPSVGDFGMVVTAPNQDSQVSVFIPIGSGRAAQYARIAWNQYDEYDYSEGELVTYDSDTKTWTASTTLIWIDTELSNSVCIDSAGDGAIFEVESIGEDTRLAVTRPLYRAKSVAVNSGYQITHFRTQNYYQQLDGYLLSDQLTEDPVWRDEGNARIQTTIGNVPKDNRIIIRIAAEWNISTGIENFKFLEISDISRGLHLYFRPISPVIYDLESKIYESQETDNEGNTIAIYRRY